jgi:hypothetical protein
MPFVIVLSLVLQFICLVHMVRSGRPYWWLWVIMLGSYLGVAVYAVTQILPDLRNDPRSRRAARSVVRTFDPERQRRRVEAELAVADTMQNRLRLARECEELGDHARAESLLQSCLQGVHADNPDVMHQLARAQFGQHRFEQARATLDGLIQAHPTFRSPDAHLLYARALEGAGEHQRAIDEYAVAAEAFPGEEGRVRYARLLADMGRQAEAGEVMQQVLHRTRIAPAYYRRNNHRWIAEAKRFKPDQPPSR